MLFTNYTYTPSPALPNVRLICQIQNHAGNTVATQYQINPQHRNKNPNKSQWTVACEVEVSIFAGAFCEGIITDQQYMWGLYIPDDVPVILGVTKNSDSSKIARFDNGKHNGFWHGYPADYIQSQELPREDILGFWRDKDYITKADINKIIRGQW